MVENSTYQHAPLDHSRDFRLVRIGTEATRTVEPSITCEFFHHYIDDAPSYSTLSYTWEIPGLDKEQLAICPNGMTLTIQPNLAAWIRTHGIFLANQGHLFWIDQLCIDQTNAKERGQQVLLMKEIYAKSSKLFVWLGPGSEESTLALETMNRAGKFFHELFQKPSHYLVSPREYYDRGFPMPDTAAWGAVYSIFKKPYFSRVWVQQEIVVSKFYEIALQCGVVSMPWIGLENTAYALVNAKSVMDAKVYDDTATSGLQGSLMRQVPSAMSGVAGLERFRAANPDSVNRTLYNLLKTFRGYQATDPRDMIFALVGMQYDSQDSALVPDYGRTTEELYTSVAYFMIKKYGISILCEAGLANRALDPLSSWVIDW